MAELLLKGNTYSIARYKLREWLKFERQQELITKAVENKNIEEYTIQLYILLSTALNIPITELSDAPWFEVYSAYVTITNLNKVKEIPLLKSDPSKHRDIPWEYDGRSWYWWLHTFAKTYNWIQETVAQLDIDDAVSLLQEILVDEQLKREWEWNLSELAYPFNKTTKKTDYKPLPRPGWMTEIANVFLPATKVKFRKSMLPVGKIIGEDGSERIVN